MSFVASSWYAVILQGASVSVEIVSVTEDNIATFNVWEAGDDLDGSSSAIAMFSANWPW